MPFISDTASAIKSRFGFSSQSSDPVPPVQSTPDLFKSTTKKNLAHQLVSASAIPSIGEWDDDSVDGSGTSSQSFELSEDPSFWKDHNVQDLLLEVCDETEIVEPKLKIGGFQMHMKRDIVAMKAPESFVSPTIEASPIPSEPMNESIPKVTPSSKPSSASMNPFKDDPEKKSPKLLAFEASGVTGHVYVPSTLVGSFLRGKKVKGRRTRHVL